MVNKTKQTEDDKTFFFITFTPVLSQNFPFNFMAFLYAEPPMIPMYGNTSAGITGNSICSHNIINSQRRVEEKKKEAQT